MAKEKIYTASGKPLTRNELNDRDSKCSERVQNKMLNLTLNSPPPSRRRVKSNPRVLKKIMGHRLENKSRWVY